MVRVVIAQPSISCSGAQPAPVKPTSISAGSSSAKAISWRSENVSPCWRRIASFRGWRSDPDAAVGRPAGGGARGAVVIGSLRGRMRLQAEAVGDLVEAAGSGLLELAGPPALLLELPAGEVGKGAELQA